MQLFFGILLGAVISLLVIKHRLSKNFGHLKVCKNDCPYYHTAVDTVKYDLAIEEYLKDHPMENGDKVEEVSNE